MSRIRELFLQKQELLRARPDKAVQEVAVSSRLVEPFESRVKIRDFEVVLDQQVNMGGNNKGPRPSELVLAALAACQEVTWRLYSEALDIPVDRIAVNARAQSDVRGFLDVADVAAGFRSVNIEVRIDSPADDESLRRLQTVVAEHCPVLDDLRNPVVVHAEMVRGKIEDDPVT